MKGGGKTPPENNLLGIFNEARIKYEKRGKKSVSLRKEAQRRLRCAAKENPEA